MKIWLVGMMGSGKSSAGRIAASNLGVPFADTDELVEEWVGTSVANYWSEHGEKAFRLAEKQVIAELERAEGIVATGGGAIVDEASRALVARSGTVVWLDARPEALAARVKNDSDRPLLTSAERPAKATLEATLEERVAIYRELADHRIPTDELAPSQVATRIEELWRS